MKQVKDNRYLVVVLWLIMSLINPFMGRSQQPPRGTFLQDSIRLGQVVGFAFSFRHPPAAKVFFPDSAYNFSPFEYLGLDIFPSSTNKSGSLDSVIYYLRTFEVADYHTLSLPVYLVNEGDSSLYKSATDTVRMIQFVTEDALRNMSPKEDYSILPYKKPIDYWKYLKIFLISLAALVLIYLFFGNYIRRQYYLLMYRKRHRNFVSAFKKHLKASDETKHVSEALILWKNHLQELEGVPFTTLTTKEIIEAIPNQRLGEALRTMDMNIYGDVQSSQMLFAMSKLLDIANERYTENRKVYKEKLKERNKRKVE